jgi:hypothetical protein
MINIYNFKLQFLKAQISLQICRGHACFSRHSSPLDGYILNSSCVPETVVAASTELSDGHTFTFQIFRDEGHHSVQQLTVLIIVSL